MKQRVVSQFGLNQMQIAVPHYNLGRPARSNKLRRSRGTNQIAKLLSGTATGEIAEQRSTHEPRKPSILNGREGSALIWT
ncbi:MAG: hypothetical protein ACYCRH_04220 [Acidiferrobacteraceae bacterium]